MTEIIGCVGEDNAIRALMRPNFRDLRRARASVAGVAGDSVGYLGGGGEYFSARPRSTSSAGKARWLSRDYGLILSRVTSGHGIGPLPHGRPRPRLSRSTHNAGVFGWTRLARSRDFQLDSAAQTCRTNNFMPSKLEISVILTTYQRPDHLERSLLSLAQQRNVAGKFEVIVADDGSDDETSWLVNSFAKIANFPLKWISHPHDGFRVALCRNDGVRASSAPYLLFTDSDCIFPPNHVQNHLAARRPGIVRAGDCYRLDE